MLNLLITSYYILYYAIANLNAGYLTMNGNYICDIQ